MRRLYTILLYLLVPIMLIRILWRSLNVPAYRERVGERFGRYSLFSRPESVIWIHAVSVGEVQAAVPMMNALRRRFPDMPLVVTTTTPTGAQRVQELFGKKVTHFYLPFDLPGSVRRFLSTIDPVIGIVMETELWPNLFHQCHQSGIPLVVANARMSESSAKGYKRFSRLTEQIFSGVTLVAAQTEADAERIRDLSRGNTQVKVTGNIKFDMILPASLYEHAQVLRQQMMKHRSVWIAASTHDGEDEYILDAYRIILSEIPDTILVLVPRHPERAAKITGLCKKYRLNSVRRSKDEKVDENTRVYIGDTLGELPLLLAISDVAFVGGSLIKHGGHNLLEPAAIGIPVVSGPHTFNFREVTRMMLANNAVEIVENSRELADTILRYLKDANLRHNRGENGKQLVAQNRGATERLTDLIANLID